MGARSNSTVGMVFALHAADPGLNLASQVVGPLRLPGAISEHRVTQVPQSVAQNPPKILFIFGLGGHNILILPHHTKH